MIYLEMIDDEGLQEPLNHLISGLLPAENYSSNFFVAILSSIDKYIKLEEFSGEYYVLMSIFRQLQRLTMSNLEYKPIVTKDSVESVVQANIYNLIRNEHVRMYDLLSINGYDSNLDIETNVEPAARLLFKKTMELYDKCMELNQDSAEAISYIPSLRESVLNNVAGQSIQIQTRILSSEFKFERKVYSGGLGWLDFSKMITSELQIRLDEEDSNGVIYLDNTDKALALLDSLNEMFVPLAEYGLPPMDTATPMLRHRLVIICANENVGKTMFATDNVGQLLCEGRKVVFMCGENASQLALAKILANYIYKKHGVYITDQAIAHKDTLEIEKQQIIVKATVDIVESGLLTLVDAFSYDNFYDELVAIYEQHEFDAVIIDHSLALNGKGDQYSNIGNLAVQARKFKKDYPCFIEILSHLSVLAKETLMKGKKVENSPTKGNSTLSAEADEIFILIDNEQLAKEGMLGINNYKRRNAPKVLDDMIVKKKFNVSTFEWDDSFQSNATGLDIEAEKAMQTINEFYEEESDDGEEYDNTELDEDDETLNLNTEFFTTGNTENE